MSVAKIFTTTVEAPIWAKAVAGVILLATFAVISWMFWFQYSATEIQGVIGRNEANVVFSIVPKEGSTWAVSESNREVATVQIDSNSAGDYRFKVISSTRPSLYVGREFQVQRASIATGDLVCDKCLAEGIKPTALPFRWRLIK